MATDAECQALRKAQDPLADVRAIMTDNMISFGKAANRVLKVSKSN